MSEAQRWNDTTGRGVFRKRVHCKPLQLVITATFEGALGVEDAPKDFEASSLRICVDCFRGRRFAEVLAVVVDQLLEAEP
jgi:hypothetical protein